MILMSACLLGFASVAFGSYAEHALRPAISEEHFRFLMTAVRYNQVYAVVTLALGLFLHSEAPLAQAPALKWSAAMFVVGTVLFSFSMYVSVTFGIEDLLLLAPFGGVSLMLAWTLLFITACLEHKNRTPANPPPQ